MLKLALIITFLLIVPICFGQQYNSADIIKKADSILIAAVGQKIFKDYYHYDLSSYYEYMNKSGKTKGKGLGHNKQTEGKFVNVSVRYIFCLHKYNTPCNTTFIEFDSLLNLIEPLNMDFIPNYVIRNDSCNFISDSSALAIAKNNFKEKGIHPVHIYLEWDYKEKLYVWTADNILTEQKDAFGNNYGELELIRINALNGTILSQRKSVYGALY